jgi:hypothetical protein
VDVAFCVGRSDHNDLLGLDERDGCAHGDEEQDRDDYESYAESSCRGASWVGKARSTPPNGLADQLRDTATTEERCARASAARRLPRSTW